MSKKSGRKGGCKCLCIHVCRRCCRYCLLTAIGLRMYVCMYVQSTYRYYYLHGTLITPDGTTAWQINFTASIPRLRHTGDFREMHTNVSMYCIRMYIRLLLPCSNSRPRRESSTRKSRLIDTILHNGGYSSYRMGNSP